MCKIWVTERDIVRACPHQASAPEAASARTTLIYTCLIHTKRQQLPLKNLDTVADAHAAAAADAWCGQALKLPF